MTNHDVACVAKGSGARCAGARSRRKGKHGELEACRELEAVTRVKWQRTAQRWGKAKADVEPADGGIEIHVEVKRYGAGLTWWNRRAERQVLSLAGEMYFAQLRHLKLVSEQLQLPELAPRCALAERWLAQATRDAEPGIVPLVLCRTDDAEWLVAWHYRDDDRLTAILREVVR
jgi:hypothetical protein